MSSNVHVKWARNTAEVMGTDGQKWTGVTVMADDDEVRLYDDDLDLLVARFGHHDVDVLVVDDRCVR